MLEEKTQEILDKLNAIAAEELSETNKSDKAHCEKLMLELNPPKNEASAPAGSEASSGSDRPSAGFMAFGIAMIVALLGAIGLCVCRLCKSADDDDEESDDEEEDDK